MKKKIGIYKIESPSKKIYIGQSKNIEERFKQYYRLTSIKNQRRLYKSLLKYGVINHKFKIIEECNIEELNIKERYWQEYYDVIGPNGLNCKYVEVTFINPIKFNLLNRLKVIKAKGGYRYLNNMPAQIRFLDKRKNEMAKIKFNDHGILEFLGFEEIKKA